MMQLPKGALICGLPPAQFYALPVPEQLRLRAEDQAALARVLAYQKAQGLPQKEEP